MNIFWFSVVWSEEDAVASISGGGVTCSDSASVLARSLRSWWWLMSALYLCDIAFLIYWIRIITLFIFNPQRSPWLVVSHEARPIHGVNPKRLNDSNCVGVNHVSVWLNCVQYMFLLLAVAIVACCALDTFYVERWQAPPVYHRLATFRLHTSIGPSSTT